MTQRFALVFFISLILQPNTFNTKVYAAIIEHDRGTLTLKKTVTYCRISFFFC